MLKGSGQTYRRAKSLRGNMSLPEVLLWEQLRRRATGYKWRRQHPAGRYILDFYCDAAKLCIEIDGEAHERGDRHARDIQRDTNLARQGIFTLRIPAVEILTNLEGALHHILAHARKRAPLHHPSGGPPPPAIPGEDR